MHTGCFFVVLTLIGFVSYQLRAEFQLRQELASAELKRELDDYKRREELKYEKLELELHYQNLTLASVELQVELQNQKIYYLEMSWEISLDVKKDEKDECKLGDYFETVTTNFKKQYTHWVSYVIEKLK